MSNGYDENFQPSKAQDETTDFNQKDWTNTQLNMMVELMKHPNLIATLARLKSQALADHKIQRLEQDQKWPER